MNKIKRMSNTPINTWPEPLLNMQCAMIHQLMFGFTLIEAMEIANGYNDNNERVEFIEANLDLIDERV